jgi:hypothetical protein
MIPPAMFVPVVSTTNRGTLRTIQGTTAMRPSRRNAPTRLHQVASSAPLSQIGCPWGPLGRGGGGV